MSLRRYWSAGEAADRLGVSREAVRQMVARGILRPTAQVHDSNNRQYRVFDPADVIILAKQRQIPGPATGKKT